MALGAPDRRHLGHLGDQPPRLPGDRRCASRTRASGLRPELDRSGDRIAAARWPAVPLGAGLQHPHRLRLRVLPLDRGRRIRRHGGPAVHPAARPDGAAELRVHARLSVRHAHRRRTGRRAGDGAGHRRRVRRHRGIARRRALRDAGAASAGTSAAGRGRRGPCRVLSAHLPDRVLPRPGVQRGVLPGRRVRRPRVPGRSPSAARRAAGDRRRPDAAGRPRARLRDRRRPRARHPAIAARRLERAVAVGVGVVGVCAHRSGRGVCRVGDVGDGAGVRGRPARVLRPRAPEPAHRVGRMDERPRRVRRCAATDAGLLRARGRGRHRRGHRLRLGVPTMAGRIGLRTWPRWRSHWPAASPREWCGTSSPCRRSSSACRDSASILPSTAVGRSPASC